MGADENKPAGGGSRWPVTVLYISLSVLPIIPVGSRTIFAMKIAALIILTNLLAVALCVSAKARARPRAES